MKSKNSRGFTLIEILVVIGIIAILAAIVIVAINPSRQFAQARDSQRNSDVSAITNAIGQYIADNKGDSSGLSIPVTTAGNISKAGVNLCSKLVPNYLAALPVDPSSGTNGTDKTAVTDCAAAYDTKYTVLQNSTTKRITVTATPDTNGTGDPISITR